MANTDPVVNLTHTVWLALAVAFASATQDIAIDEWMAASPIYSVRTQELLGFRGDTVDVILTFVGGKLVPDNQRGRRR